MCAFRDPICIGILGLFSILAASACNSSISGPASIPLDVVFETPKEKILGGIRLAPRENKWDGYGEAIDVRGDILVIGASEWNPCGHGSAYVYRFRGGMAGRNTAGGRRPGRFHPTSPAF